MAKNRTIDAQFYFAMQSINLCDDMEKRKEIFENETGNVSGEKIGKRDFKREGLSQKFIFSHTTMKNYLSICRDFAKYCKIEGINKANKITPQIAKNFLESKATEGVSDRTLKTYKNALIKLNEAITSTYNCRGFCRGDDNIKNFVIATPEAIDRRLTNSQIDTILENYKGKFSAAFQLQADFGLRFNEIVNLNIADFNFGRGDVVDTVKQGQVDTSCTLHIHKGTKGGLERFVNIPLDKLPYYREMVSQWQNKGLFMPFKDYHKECYNRAIKNQAEKNNFGRCGSSHEFRKYWASTEYQSRIDDTMTRAEKKEIAREIVSQLGHGKARDDLIKIYIGRL